MKKSKPPIEVVHAPLLQRALHLGCILNRHIQILCEPGGLCSSANTILGSNTTKIVIDEKVWRGEVLNHCYILRADYDSYVKCCKMIEAQESN